jgi:hypothetical protein
VDKAASPAPVLVNGNKTLRMAMTRRSEKAFYER